MNITMKHKKKLVLNCEISRCNFFSGLYPNEMVVGLKVKTSRTNVSSMPDVMVQGSRYRVFAEATENLKVPKKEREGNVSIVSFLPSSTSSYFRFLSQSRSL